MDIPHFKEGTEVIALDTINAAPYTILQGCAGKVIKRIDAQNYAVVFKVRRRNYAARKVHFSKITPSIAGKLDANAKQQIQQMLQAELQLYYLMIDRVENSKDFMFLTSNDKANLTATFRTIITDYEKDLVELSKPEEKTLKEMIEEANSVTH